MDEARRNELLKARGWRVADTAVNGEGRFVKLLERNTHASVAMFASDAEDLATGRATIEQIIARNRGADLADPWPIVGSRS